MPLFLYLLGLAVFAQGTSEFMLAGLGPDIARDLGVPLSDAGLLTSAFAVGMVIGAPAMALLARRFPPRAALLAFLAAFLAVHVAGALTGSFAVLLAMRVLGALANAGFLAVALATAVTLVRPDQKGRATSVLLGGVTLACVAGVPAGALLGQLWGWRAAFWAVAAVSAPALLAILRSAPAANAATAPAPEHTPDVTTELRTLRRRSLQLTLLLGALVNGATFCAFTYLAPVITDAARLAESWVPALLALFGLGSFLGVTLAGRFGDGRPRTVLAGGTAALLCAWTAFALTAHWPVATTVATLTLGTLSFAVGATLISRILYAAEAAPTLGGAYATAAFNVGAVIGPALGGLALTWGPRGPLWVSAGLVAAALAATPWMLRVAEVTSADEAAYIQAPSTP
ncbi:Cmx/CmrA family chloramphenicol efflux MFS transporter [Streptomyces indicus]|uniref:MFS transporter, DHA1 family, chloramphenicol resistance protein n=1 Tax=Streptomyces indicus TaxID=417292 RepID=A0A1G9BL17_9ACTN|nr:Cmx/CmrA family chloramphenicol efflux MFS transporter [Streptomyces indicus]SDK39565.1 MFS transporter, DHA1 family, chloramphenicol resistance protein [Streptomyces indicus]